MSNKINRQDCKIRRDYHYAVYEHKLEYANHLAYIRPFIVLRNQYGVIIRFTVFHNFIGVYEGNVCSPLTSDASTKMLYVYAMLNYILLEHYERFGINHVFEVTKNILNIFFQDYAKEKLSNGTYRSKQSVEKCIFSVVGFFRKLCINSEDIWQSKRKSCIAVKWFTTIMGGLRKNLFLIFK